MRQAEVPIVATKPFDWKLEPGENWAVVGPSGAGKTRFLEVFFGPVECARADHSVSGRMTPQKLIRRLPEGRDVTPGQIGEVFSMLGLWDCRASSISSLSPSRVAACRLIPALVSPANCVVLDCDLDSLGPWVLERVIDGLLARPQSVVVATNRLDVAERFANLLVFHEQALLWSGRTADLLAQIPASKFTVQCGDASTVESVVASFAIDLAIEGNTLRFRSPNGQEIAARLLTEGYGNVELVSIQPPDLRSAIDTLIARHGRPLGGP